MYHYAYFNKHILLVAFLSLSCFFIKSLVTFNSSTSLQIFSIAFKSIISIFAVLLSIISPSKFSLSIVALTNLFFPIMMSCFANCIAYKVNRFKIVHPTSHSVFVNSTGNI